MQNSETGLNSYTKIFISICIAWFIIWSTIPFFLFEGVFSDTIEWIANTQNNFSWGYDNHPYLGAWILGSVAFWGDLRLAYFGCQVCIFASLLSIWKFARYFRAPAESLIAASIILLTPTYSFLNLVFTQNVVLMAIWPLIILFFYKALLHQKYIDWLLLGLFCGLGLMTKYFCVFLFVPMALMMLFTKEGRVSFNKIGFYLCSAVFLIVIIPNIIWLFNNDFSSIDYAFYRTRLKETVPIISHVTSPIKCVGLILANFIVSIPLLIICFSKRTPVSISTLPAFTRKFINIMGITPLLLVVMFALTTGAYIKPEWLFPTTILFGVIAVELCL
jgi:4-amino-4-deoxy-L-arabinose transferase-like glycosyltransferase